MLRWSQRVIAYDDAYISFRYAKNLTQGIGLVFNEGVRVEGYTNFAWTLLSAAAIGLDVDPLLATRTVGVFSYAAVAATLSFFWLRWTEHDAFRWLGLPVLWLVFARTGFAAHAGTGLETMAVALMIMLVGVLAFAIETRWWVSALVAGLLCITRIDAGLVVPVVALVLLLQGRSSGAGWTESARAAAQWASIPCAIVATHIIFRLAYYGQLLPNTYYAKAGGWYALARGASYLGTVVYAVPETGALLLTALAGVALSKGRVRALIGYGALYVTFYALYLLKVGGDFMEYRFMWTIYPVLMLAGFRALVVIGERSRVSGVLCAALLVGLTFTQRPPGTDHFGFPNIIRDRYTILGHDVINLMVDEGTLVGTRLRQVLPPDTIIATTLAGTVPYFSELRSVDQWGLSEPYVRHQPPHPQYARGHVKRATNQYLKDAGVQLCVDHPRICSCKRPCREERPNVFVRLGDDQCLRTWYFQQSPELTAHFCEHPEWFLLNRIRCEAPP
ncbi:MAG: hypothetical protein WBB42_14155 [Polyangiales bacterium]